MKSNPRIYYTIGILIALCVTTIAKNQRQGMQKTRRYLQNRKASMNRWGNLAFELEPSLNHDSADASQE